MQDLTPERLAELDRLEKLLSPWEVIQNGLGQDCYVNTGDHGHPGPFRDGPNVCVKCRAAVALRNAAPDLIREVSRLREECDKLRAEHAATHTMLERYQNSAIDAWPGGAIVEVDQCTEALATIIAERDSLREENERLRGDMELANAERSSAFGACSVLFKALGWSSGGLASAAMEIVAARDAAEKRAGDLQKRIEEAQSYLPIDRDLTVTEAEIASSLADSVPLSEGRIKEIVDSALARRAASGEGEK